MAIWRPIVQEHLIEVCHRALDEYAVGGFRFDAAHSCDMDHGFLRRLAADVKASKPATLLVVENLPNEPDLNLAGFDGYAQWYDSFHDGLIDLVTQRVPTILTSSVTRSTSAGNASPHIQTTWSTTPSATIRTAYPQRCKTRRCAMT